MPTAFFALLLALQAAAPAPAVQAAKAPVPVHIVDLHLSYDVPAGLAMDPGLAAAAVKAEQDKATGVEKAAAACVTSPVMAADPTENFRMIAVVQIDFACIGQPVKDETLSEVVASTLKGSLGRFGEGVMGAPVKYQVGAYPAAFVRGSVKSEKFAATFHASATCLLIDKTKMGCWEFIAMDDAAVDKLAALPVHFDGQPPVALVPAVVAAKSK